ncbi:hypothetical protein ABEB36_000641 [Hypothenemus hampei]|uniref:Uncharacterized protein n=1 Tax=Hypothenemus hampei TaxID=57062 RepID=A0ABD1FFI8_HYPHA
MGSAIQHRTIRPGCLIPKAYQSLIYAKHYTKSMTYPVNGILIGFLFVEIYFYFSETRKIINARLLLFKTTKIFFALTDNFKNVFTPNINDMEQELRKTVNSISFKAELFVVYLGACTLVTIQLCTKQLELLSAVFLSSQHFPQSFRRCN